MLRLLASSALPTAVRARRRWREQALVSMALNQRSARVRGHQATQGELFGRDAQRRLLGCKFKHRLVPWRRGSRGSNGVAALILTRTRTGSSQGQGLPVTV